VSKILPLVRVFSFFLTDNLFYISFKSNNMDTKEEIFYDQNGYNQGEVIRQFILEFARQYPYIDVQGVPTDVIKEFLYQPHVVNSGTEKKMDLLQDYLVSQGLCEVTP